MSHIPDAPLATNAPPDPDLQARAALHAPTGLSVGRDVQPAPVQHPARVTLEGRFVTLAPLDPARDAPALHAATNGPERERIWLYMGSGPFPDLAAFRAYCEALAAADDPLIFAIRRADSGETIGHAGLMRIEPQQRVIEIGNLVFSPAMQRTPAATESIALLASYVFDTLGYRRCEWKCNALNTPSRRAAERFGFTYEGTFRQHMIVKGRNRDTAWFSMTDGEWPACRAAFAAWLAPDNFDAQGYQRRKLQDIRAGSC